MDPTSETSLRLSKHHGAGNDFLVLVDREGTAPVDAALARALCDRHFGVGADGLIRVLPGSEGADLTMELRNADGGLAEMSGNGVRCLAQAAVEAGLVGPSFTVATGGGLRQVEFLDGPTPTAWVEMGAARLGSATEAGVGEKRALEVDVGNPHLVVRVDDPSAIDVAGLGSSLEVGRPGGVNVEFVAPGADRDELVLRVWERGAGETLACGTGAVAAAAAARHWGEAGDRVVVHSPGGALEVCLDGDRARLSGPVRKVADVVVEVGSVLAAVRP